MAVQKETRASAADGERSDPRDDLAVALARATLALGRAGQPVEALRLAAIGFAAVRHDRPAAAKRLNGVMHSLARLPGVPQPTTEESPMPDTKLDVRSEVPARRHELIFETFAKLAPSDGFELINDHDPKPLYYQLEAEHKGTFSWDYLEEGPQVWRVRIGRTAA